MIFEYLSTTFILASTLGLLYILKYSYSVHMVIKKYAHIPGPVPVGIIGFFFGNIPAIIEYFC